MEATDPAVLKVLRKLNALGRPACRVYGRSDCFLIQPMALFSQVYLMHVGPVVKLERTTPPGGIGEGALAALAAYAEFPDRPPPPEGMSPLLAAAGVKSARGFTLGSAMVSVERVGKRIAIVPYNSETNGAQTRSPMEVLCAPRPQSVGERVIELLGTQEKANRYWRGIEREYRDEIEAERRGGGPERRKSKPSRSRTVPAAKRGKRK